MVGPQAVTIIKITEVQRQLWGHSHRCVPLEQYHIVLCLINHQWPNKVNKFHFNPTSWHPFTEIKTAFYTLGIKFCFYLLLHNCFVLCNKGFSQEALQSVKIDLQNSNQRDVSNLAWGLATVLGPVIYDDYMSALKLFKAWQGVFCTVLTLNTDYFPKHC